MMARAEDAVEGPHGSSRDQSMLRVDHVWRTFTASSSPVLQDFTLDVARGEFVSVIGPSGCGKTTLLRIVGGLLSATSGEVFVNGRLSDGPSTDKAMVFQHFNLFPWRTVAANAGYALEIQGVPKQERDRRVGEYLKLMGLSGFETHFPSQISGGMRQRVGIARALAVEPAVLLMDEPFGALDALNREFLQDELQKIAEVRSLTVLFITHSIDEAIYLSDRVVVMGTRPGRIVDEYEVSLPRPRWKNDVRALPEFARLRGKIWSILQGELAQQRELALIDGAAPVGSGE